MSKDDNGKNAYKDTLNLPRTNFDMKAGLLAKEPAIQAQWAQRDLYGRIRQARAGAPRFVLHDGPPYANGDIHTGHALNKTLKDIVVRYKTMTGFDSPIIHGWDCHGQPIEQKIVEQFAEKMQSMSPAEVRGHCQKYATKYVGIQAEQMKRLGVLGDFTAPYITMAPQYEAATLEVFAQLVEKGIVYRQLKPVHWSIENRTALADAELEYHDRTDTSIYVAFKVEGRDESLLVWTTTPWTLPANLAVAVHPDFQYVRLLCETADGPMMLIMVADRIEAVLAAIRAKRGEWLKSHKVVSTMPGRDLLAENLKYGHPLHAGKLCPVVPADYVTVEDGTGLVHTAPGHGMEDYGTALKCKLDIYCPVKEDGTFDKTAPTWLAGLSVWKANPKVIEFLREARTLVLDEPITHSYPHDWRSKTPTIFRATEQWFIAVDRPLTGTDQTLRDLALEACKRPAKDGGIDFVPAWGRNRIRGMLESRPDWCISRQRSWGLPIPAFYNADGQSLLTPASVRAVSACFAKKGSDSWFTATTADLLAGYDPHKDPDLKNPDKFDLKTLKPGRDILDVWFESGASWFAVAMQRGLVDEIPVDLYLEGADQHRGWFQLSLLPALGATGKPPMKTIVTHGWVMDENGRKMSKSLGNTINVVEQIAKRGADIIRLWVSMQNYTDDVNCSDNLMVPAEDAYRKIRNTLRFAMGACADLDVAHHAAEPEAHSIDRWMLLELQQLIKDVRAAYESYEFHKAARLLHEFCSVQASSVYFAAVKDRLYCEHPASPRRRATQTVIHKLLVALVKMLAPIIPHTCDEAWGHIPFRDSAEPDSVHLASMPECDKAMLRLAEDVRPVSGDLGAFTADVLTEGPAWVWDRLLDLRAKALLKLEAIRNAGVKNSMDTEAVFTVPAGDEATAKFVTAYLSELEDMLGVGFARVQRGDVPDGQPVGIEVLDAREKYQRCARCWKRRPDVGSDAEYPDLSARDAAVIRELKKA